MKRQKYAATEVFVSGAYPELTFNERLDTDLKKTITNYLRKGAGHCLLVHGASKTGKTVLVERYLPNESAIWIKGDEIATVTDLYRRIIDDLGLYTEVSATGSSTATVGGGGGAEVGIPGAKFRIDANARAQITEGDQASRSSLSVSVVKAALKAKPVPLVLDDFHFMDAKLRLEVAKAVKDLVRLARVVLIAIPHASFEPLRTLPDMDWRVETLEVKPWTDPELAQIARVGFQLLGIDDVDAQIGARCAAESRGAPAIMQTLCLEYVTEVMGAWETAHPSRQASAPTDWGEFLREIARGKKPIAFDALVAGKEVRGMERTERVLVTGERTDIYGAVLLTLSRMGAFGSVTKTEIAEKMQQLIVDSPPASTISGNLNHLAEIAEKVRGTSDPALTYQDPELQILDPYLSFFLAHGDWTLPTPRQKADSGRES